MPKQIRFTTKMTARYVDLTLFEDGSLYMAVEQRHDDKPQRTAFDKETVDQLREFLATTD